MERIAHMVDEVCKEVETRTLCPGAKRGGNKEDSSKPSDFLSSKRMFVFFPKITSSDHLYEEASRSLNNKRNEAKKNIHEVKCKSPQGGCIRGEVEVECTARFLVGDLQITDSDVVSCMGEETLFGSDPK